MMKDDTFFLNQALTEAKKAQRLGDVPVGAVIVIQNKIISRGFNNREQTQNPLGHAEMIAIQKACKKLKSWRLDEAALYVTVEPCSMCAGALVQARISRVVYGCHSLDHTNELARRLDVTHGILEVECRNLIQKFFKELRKPSSGRGVRVAEGARLESV